MRVKLTPASVHYINTINTFIDLLTLVILLHQNVHMVKLHSYHSIIGSANIKTVIPLEIRM